MSNFRQHDTDVTFQFNERLRTRKTRKVKEKTKQKASTVVGAIQRDRPFLQLVRNDTLGNLQSKKSFNYVDSFV